MLSRMLKFIKENWSMALADLILINVALMLAFGLRFDWDIPPYFQRYLLDIAVFIAIVRMILLVYHGAYKGVIRYAGISELLAIAKATTMGSLIIFASTVFFVRSWGIYPRSVIVIEWLGDIILLGGLRLSLRLLNQRRINTIYRNLDRKRVLIIGAGDAGEMVARQLAAHPEYGYLPVGFIDDDKAKSGKIIHGMPIFGGRESINHTIDAKQIEQIIIAIPSATGSVVREVVEACKKSKLAFKIVPSIKDIINGEVNLDQIRDVAVEDLLRRPPVNSNLEEISGYIAGRTVLVTGAGGSIGSELCRQLSGFGPKLLILVGRGENSLYEIDQELRQKGRELNYITCIGDINDRSRMDAIFEKHRPDVVFHAAAHKHVPMMEHNAGEAIKNNIFGTQAVAEAAIKSGTKRFVMISTDKAVNPSSVMGATKRMAEEMLRTMNSPDHTRFIIVRFGNVLGSRGSVVPLFQKQIASGGPITVTHPLIERYFMTIPEAVQLVIQAGSMGSGGEVYVLDMGQPVKIVDLARDLIKLSGLEPDHDIRIEYTGLRPGEKLYEELFTAEEGVSATNHPQIFMAKSRPDDKQRLPDMLAQLREAAQAGGREAVVTVLQRHLPTYQPLSNAEEQTDANTTKGLST